MNRAFTLVEAVVAGAIFLMIAGVMVYVFVQSRGVEEGVGLQVGLLENVTLSLHAIRTDLRHLCIMPGQSLDGYSFKVFDNDVSGDHGIMLRVASPVRVTTANVEGSHYTIVAYHLVRTDRWPDRYHLARTESTSSGVNLPGKTVNKETKVYRSFTLKRDNTTFIYKPKGSDGVEVLHVALDVVSDTGRGATKAAFSEKGFVVTSVIRLVKPDLPFDPDDPPSFHFAQTVTPTYSPFPPVPPGNVRAPEALQKALKPADHGYPP